MSIVKLLFFNRITKSYLALASKYFRPNKRLQSMATELLYALSVFVPLILVKMVISIFSPWQPFQPYWTFNNLLFSALPFGLLTFIILNKDFYNGQSVVHRILGYKVVQVRTLNTASILQCMLRNITMPIWPIEGLVVLISPKRRLGDFIAGTKLIEVQKSNPEEILKEVSGQRQGSAILLTIVISCFIIVGYSILFDPQNKFW